VGLAALGAGAWLFFAPARGTTTAGVTPTEGGAALTMAGRF